MLPAIDVVCRMLSWLPARLTIADGIDATEGVYYRPFGPDLFPQEAIIEAGASEIPLHD